VSAALSSEGVSSVHDVYVSVSAVKTAKIQTIFRTAKIFTDNFPMKVEKSRASAVFTAGRRLRGCNLQFAITTAFLHLQSGHSSVKSVKSVVVFDRSRVSLSRRPLADGGARVSVDGSRLPGAAQHLTFLNVSGLLFRRFFS